MICLTKILFLIFLAANFSGFKGSQARSQLHQSQPVGFRCVISVSKQAVLPFESIGILVRLQNESTKVHKELASWAVGLAIREVTIERTEWYAYRPDTEPIASPPLPSVIELGPGESKTWIRPLDFQARGRHVFDHPGRYQIVGNLGYKIRGRDDGYFESEPLEITVLNPKGIDDKAYQFLQTSDVHKYFSEHTVWKYPYTKETADQVEEFIARFQKSRYADLARLGLARMWIQGVEGKKDFQKATSLLQQLARSDDKTLVARAQYNLAKLAEEQGKLIEAEKYYSQALSLKIDPYFKYLASQAQVDVKHRLSQPWRD